MPSKEKLLEALQADTESCGSGVSDALAQPQFWNAALTIATRLHAQLLQMHDTLEDLATEQVAQWFGRSQAIGHCIG